MGRAENILEEEDTEGSANKEQGGQGEETYVEGEETNPAKRTTGGS